MNPEVSIVMPVYNGQQFLQESLDSIFCQTFADFELIVIDDGSSDRTPAILAACADTRLRVARLDHAGIVAALNEGLRLARGEWIARIDHDDLMVRNRLERQLIYLRANPELGGAGSYYHIIDATGALRGSKEIPLRTPEELREFLERGGRLIYPHPTMMFRKSVALSIGGYRSEYLKSEDVDFFLRMVESGWPLLIQPEYLIKFRYHSNSESAANIRVQFHFLEIIFGNYRRRLKNQPEISIEEYFRELSRKSLPRRLLLESQLLSKRMMRRQDMARARGARGAAILFLILGAIFEPGPAVRKARRLVRAKSGLKKARTASAAAL
jgi:glycosyltransferase involved in cell wall biosynthesis